MYAQWDVNYQEIELRLSYTNYFTNLADFDLCNRKYLVKSHRYKNLNSNSIRDVDSLWCT